MGESVGPEVGDDIGSALVIEDVRECGSPAPEAPVEEGSLCYYNKNNTCYANACLQALAARLCKTIAPGPLLTLITPSTESQSVDGYVEDVWNWAGLKQNFGENQDFGEFLNQLLRKEQILNLFPSLPSCRKCGSPLIAGTTWVTKIEPIIEQLPRSQALCSSLICTYMMDQQTPAVVTKPPSKLRYFRSYDQVHGFSQDVLSQRNLLNLDGDKYQMYGLIIFQQSIDHYFYVELLSDGTSVVHNDRLKKDFKCDSDLYNHLRRRKCVVLVICSELYAAQSPSCVRDDLAKLSLQPPHSPVCVRIDDSVQSPAVSPGCVREDSVSDIFVKSSGSEITDDVNSIINCDNVSIFSSEVPEEQCPNVGYIISSIEINESNILNRIVSSIIDSLLDIVISKSSPIVITPTVSVDKIQGRKQVCPKCKCQFTAWSSMKSHLTKKHEVLVKQDILDLMYKLRKTYEKEFKSEVKCTIPDCGQSFINLKALDQHLCKAHKKGDAEERYNLVMWYFEMSGGLVQDYPVHLFKLD